jgi:hypothetical protein
MKDTKQIPDDTGSLEVRINWDGLRRFLKFEGSVDEMRRLEVPRHRTSTSSGG